MCAYAFRLELAEKTHFAVGYLAEKRERKKRQYFAIEL